MPYVPPGQAEPLSSIPNPLSSLKDPKSESSISHTQSNPSSDSHQSSDHTTPPSTKSPSTMIPTPSADLSSSLSHLNMDPAPPTTSSPTSLPTDAEEIPSSGDGPRRDSQHSTKTTSSLPALTPHSANSASSSSIASSFGDSSPGTTTGLTSPVTVADDGGREGGIARYREGLYAYTRGLYLEAKLSVTKEEKRRGSVSSNGFAPKQSGMEKLAAKKALAKRLNAGTYERD